MKKLIVTLAIFVGAVLWSPATNSAEEVKASVPPTAPAAAPAAPAAPADPDINQRVADLEAYINNGTRGSDAPNAKVKSNVAGSGPGHNGWMMTSAALVLFMTLPGL